MSNTAASHFCGAILHEIWGTQTCFKVNVCFFCCHAFKTTTSARVSNHQVSPTRTVFIFFVEKVLYTPDWVASSLCNQITFQLHQGLNWEPCASQPNPIDWVTTTWCRVEYFSNWCSETIATVFSPLSWWRVPLNWRVHTNLLASNAKMIGSPPNLWSNKSSAPVSSCSPLLALSLASHFLSWNKTYSYNGGPVGWTPWKEANMSRSKKKKSTAFCRSFPTVFFDVSHI